MYIPADKILLAPFFLVFFFLGVYHFEEKEYLVYESLEILVVPKFSINPVFQKEESCAKDTSNIKIVSMTHLGISKSPSIGS